MSEGEAGYEAPRIYTGLNEQHGIPWIEKGWRVQSSEEFPEVLQNLRIDDRISEIVREEISKSNKEIVVFDIGSGRDGILVKSFLNFNSFPKLHKILTEIPGIKVRVVGVTGADKEEFQGKLLEKNEQEFGEYLSEKSKIITENYAYTITKAHTLKNFMDMVDVGPVNASFSTFGVGYFTPANFEQCIGDLVDKLADGGEFYGISWDAVPAGAMRSPFGGTFVMSGSLPEKHPLHKALGGFSSNESFRRFYEQTPEKQVESHLAEIEYGLKSGLFSIGQVRELLVKTKILPMPAFVRDVHRYTDKNQQQKISNHIKLLSWLYPSLSNFRWDGKTPLFDEIRSLRDEQFKKSIELGGTGTDDKKKRKVSYKDAEKAERKVWDYIEKKFSSRKRNEVSEQKEKFDKTTIDAGWDDIKKNIKNLNPETVAQFWDWDVILWKLQQLIIDKQAKKTTEMKQAVLDRLAHQANLTVHTSRLPDGYGLNLYIKKQV